MTIIANKTYFIKRHKSASYLNIYGASYTGDKQPIKLWSKVEDDPMQKWQFDGTPTSGAFLCTICDLSRAINLYSTKTPNCTIWAKAGNEKDGAVRIRESSPGVYYIYLINHNLYLTATSTEKGTQVTWQAQIPGSYTQLWEFEEETLKVPSKVPSSIVNQTFFIKNNGTGKNLNVNGYDTVSNSTNVNIYNKEDCLAQRWIAKDTPNGPKLFTKIDESFALNIYNNNCTMYKATGNDKDSLLIFIPKNRTEKTFYIKMYHHNKYLRAEGSVNGSNVCWSDTCDDYALWQFVDENTMFAPADPTPSAIKGQKFYLRAGNSACYLNVHGTDTVAVGRNVNVYSKDKCNAQSWIADDHYGKPRLFTKINRAFGLNIYSKNNPNCTMYTVEGNDEDSVLKFEYVAEKQYRIKMHYHNKYLAVDGNIVSGANVIWVDSISAATIWTFETEDEVFVPAPAAPSEIVNKTCFIRADGTTYYLNVHGSDTVANTRNVDIFTVENCRAQRWVARGTKKDPKLHTTIDEKFALNIYKDDCTMYTAAGNDMDSILQFEYDSPMKYRIKMFHHNKYLAISGRPSIGADVIWVDNASNANIWEFIPEEDMNLPEGSVPGAFTADSPFVTTVAPAHTNNFTPNRSANGSSISEICIHHTAGNISVTSLGALWQKPNRAGSSHYGVNGTQVGQYVKESDIAWTNGHWESNKRSVTIETANSSGGPDWRVSDETLNTLIILVADIARRNHLGKLVVDKNLTYHSMYSTTLCPGPYLKSKLYEIAASANKINNYIETKPQELLGKTFYIQNYNSKKYINICSASNILNLDMAGDKNSQRWKIESNVTGVKMVSKFKGKTTLIIGADNKSCDFVSNSKDSDDLNMEIIPYTNDTISYSDNINYIKLKNRNLFLAAVGSSLYWVASINTACLWKFMTEEEVIPEIIQNKKDELALEIIKNYNLYEVNPDLTIQDLWNHPSITGPISITPKAIIKSKYELHDSHTFVGDKIEGITVDYTSDGNGTYTIDANTFGLDNALLNLEISGKDNAYKLATNIGNKFPGGVFYFSIKPILGNHAEFEIIYNLSLLPDNKTINSNVSFKAIYDVTFTSKNPEYEFVLDPELVPNIIAVAIFIVIIIGIFSGAVSIPASGLLGTLYHGLPALNFIVPVLATTSEKEE